jgi:uncharacterized protein (TIRG00374 family)
MAFIVLRIVVIVGIVAIAVWKLNIDRVHDSFHIASWGFMAAAVMANFASVAFKGLAWKAVVDGLPAVRQRTRYMDLLSPLFVGFLFNTVLAARVGEIVKVLLAKRRLERRGQRPYTTSLMGTVVAENLISTITWVALVFAIGFFLPLPSYAWVASTALGVGCLAIVLVAFLAGKAGHRQLPPWLNTGPLWTRFTRALARLWGGVRESHAGLRDPRQLGLVIGASLATWLAQWVGIYCTLIAFGLDRVGWGGAGLLLVTITLAQAFPVLPGNLGVFQAAAIVPLTASYGVDATAALAFSIVLQATEAIIGVVVGFGFLIAEGVGFGQLRRQAEEEERRSSREHPPVDTLAGP